MRPDDSSEDLVTLLESVEAFEVAVQSRGGDLMMDEPVGAAAAIAPDDAAFVLPRRNDGESVAEFIGRISFATSRARGKRG